uniref:Uncharacterized protein n=1 Tax=Ananas comosus var. bracteatus TaxID=296719 RepID=A0A6V7NSS0_ANACO|nr:unnamed protein product [Ananas comosus var. bracteatus]
MIRRIYECRAQSSCDAEFPIKVHLTKIGEVWDTMPVTDKQNPLSLKKVALRELPNESKNIITTPPRNNLPLKSKGVSPESTKIIGTKRQTPDNPTSPSTYQQSNTSANRHLVYVRRKLENEQGKISTCTNVESVDSPESKITRKDGKAEQNLQNDQRDEPKVASFPIFLKNCDQSSQEDYIRMLRSLSAAGRSKHAVELEKRAIQLLLEEGKELHRMKVLNVLGKASPKDHLTVSPQTSSLHPYFQQ